MKYFLCLVVLFFSFATYAQSDRVKIWTEQNDNGLDVFVQNGEFCPISIVMDFEVKNMTFSHSTDSTFVVQPQQNKLLLLSLKVKDPRQGISFSWSYQYNLGLHEAKANNGFQYYLPFAKGQSYRVDQGYNGAMSHHGINALDFTMPEGQQICAVRAGTIIDVVQHNNKHCADRSCSKYNNSVLIYHDDGTFSEYSHIMYQGALVKRGDQVKAGQPIARSGQVGWTTGPHLHLEIFVQNITERNTLATTFLVDDGTQAVRIAVGKSYLRAY